MDDGFDDIDDELFCQIPLDQDSFSLPNPTDNVPRAIQSETNDRDNDSSAFASNKESMLVSYSAKHKYKIENTTSSAPLLSSHEAKDAIPMPEPKLDPPEEFPFPFKPYDIQVGFMQNLYRALDQGKVGIFESPTGTGKSMSLICGALRWLKDFQEKQRQELDALLEEKRKEEVMKQEQNHELDWVAAFVKKKEEKERKDKLKESHDLLLRREARMKELRSKIKPRLGQSSKRKRDALEDDFDELFKEASEELKSHYEADKASQQAELEGGSGFDEADENLVAEYVSDEERTEGKEKDKDNEDEEDHVTKIYYCSRTHSQIAQFVREIMKSPYGSDTRVVSLGSRQNLCVNESVRRLKHLGLMNDRCLELQKNKTAKSTADSENQPRKRRKGPGTCPYYKQQAMGELRDSILVNIKDIEELVQTAKDLKACPYYASRYAVPAAEVVALPYNTLLHKPTRESCGIRLKDNIVIIDEAHNLVETITSVYGAQVSGSQISCAHSQLSQYLSRYQTRLKAKNLMYIRQILFILSSLLKFLGGKTGQPAEEQKLQSQETKLKTINDFLFETKLDNLNLFKILKYCEKSQIAKKLHGFVEKYQPTVTTNEPSKEKSATAALSSFLKELSSDKNKMEESVEVEKKETANVTLSSPLMQITAFFEALTNSNKDGRIVIAKQELLSTSYIKFLLLNPAVHFTEVLKEARAVIVAGGTMQPLSEFKDQLFYASGVTQDRILEYSCGHVIEKDHLLPVALGRGPSGHLLDFTYQNRDTPETLDELGRVVYTVCNAVPGGVVLFFPSYDYERLAHAHWQKHSFLDKIAAKKRVFREPKKSNQVDSVLAEYASCIKKHLSNKYSALTGAILFGVVGGKMSEGINFSDDLGRCVIMVGLPYPNIKSPELKEKMDYLNATMPKSADGREPSQVHYENLCMKAVNQCIGRAIRHKEDYACVLLVDHRYLKPSMKTKLSSWISGCLQPIERFGPALSQIRQFFAGKKKPD